MTTMTQILKWTSSLAVAITVGVVVTNGLADQPDSPSQAAKHHVAALARPAASDDALPREVSQGPLNDDAILNTEAARRVRGGGHSAWLTLTTDGASVCHVAGGAMDCPPVAYLLAHGLSPAVSMRPGEPVHVSAITTDDIASVAVTLANGTIQSVAVTANLMSLDVDDMPKEMTWTGPSGPERFVFPHLQH